MHNLGLLIHASARALKAEFERRSRASKLTLMQWRALGALGKYGGMTQAALAARIEVSPMGVSDLLDRLEAMGYVRRAADPSDGRAKLVQVTEAAAPLMDEMKAIADDVYRIALDGIPPGDLAALERTLATFARNLEAAAQDDGKDRKAS